VLSSDAGTYELLTFLREFQRAKEILLWTTSPILFQKFKTLRQGFHHQKHGLQKLKQLVCKQCNTTLLADALTGFKNSILGNEDYYDDQMDYIQQINKPQEMKPGAFLTYLHIQNSMVQDIPGSTGGFNDIQLCMIYLNAMLSKWQSTFQDGNKNFTDTMLNAMHTYFNKQHNKDPYMSMTNPYQKINDSDTTDNNSNKGDNSNNIDNQDTAADNQGNLSTDNNPSQDRIRNVEQCPLPNHQGHMWGLCNQNNFNDARLAARSSYDKPAYRTCTANQGQLPIRLSLISILKKKPNPNRKSTNLSLLKTLLPILLLPAVSAPAERSRMQSHLPVISQTMTPALT
jgi:hypothetical protein